jgi:cation diffusion facilitator family transporter
MTAPGLPRETLDSMRSDEATARRISAFSLAASAALATVKIGVGLSAGSTAVVSDGVESASDCVTSGLVLLGLWIAAKPSDSDHPYGHGRFEILTGLTIGVLLAVVGTGICLQSLIRRNAVHPLAGYAIWPLLLSIGVKGYFASAKFRAARRTGSSSLHADAWHDLLDLSSGLVALAGLSVALLHPEYVAADHWAGVGIGLIVIFVGLRVARETGLQLTDTMPDTRQMSEIRGAAVRVPGAKGVEKCFARKTGLRYHVDLHLEVDPELTVRESHDIATAVRIAVKTDVPWVEDVLVHVEPYGMAELERVPIAVKDNARRASNEKES